MTHVDPKLTYVELVRSILIHVGRPAMTHLALFDPVPFTGRLHGWDTKKEIKCTESLGSLVGHVQGSSTLPRPNAKRGSNMGSKCLLHGAPEKEKLNIKNGVMLPQAARIVLMKPPSSTSVRHPETTWLKPRCFNLTFGICSSCLQTP